MTETIQTRRGALGLLAGGALAAPALALGGSVGPSVDSACVILVRHAEKRKDDPRDPELTELGHRRARELAKLVKAAGVSEIHTTEYRRTQQTVAPAGEATGIAVRQYDARDSEGFAEALRRLKAGSCALVAGHSNTVPAIVRALGGSLRDLDEKGYIDDAQYDRVIILTLIALGGEGMALAHTLDLRMTVD